MNYINLKIVISILILSGFTYCDSGGSSKTTTPGVIPTVSSTNPAGSETGVSKNVEIKVTFDTDMESSTINSTNITLDDGSVPVAASVSYSSKIATITPDSELSGNGYYNVIVTTNVKSSGGENMASQYTFSFITTNMYLTETIPTAVGNQPFSIVKDSGNSNVYIAGSYTGTVDFDSGAGTEEHVSANSSSDIYLTKYSSDGTHVWTRTLGGDQDDYCYGAAIDGLNNVYIVGTFQGSAVDFDPTAGTDPISTTGNMDAFITKIKPDGTYGWTQKFGGTTNDYAYAVTVGADIFILGTYSGTVDFDWGAGSESWNSSTDGNTFVTKITDGASPTYNWTRPVKSSAYNIDRPGITANSNAVFVASYFSGTFDFDWGGTTDSHTASSKDGFLTKINLDGTYGWTQKFGGTGDDKIFSVLSDGNNNIYFTGIFQDTVDFDWGTGGGEVDSHSVNDVTGHFITKINNDDSYGWTRTFSNSTTSGFDRPYAMTFNGFGHIYITGTFSNTIDFDWGVSTDEHTASNSNGDLYITKVLSDGTYGWTKHLGGDNQSIGFGIVSDNINNILYLTGLFTGTIDVNPDNGFDPNTDTETISGTNSMFIWKYQN